VNFGNGLLSKISIVAIRRRYSPKVITIVESILKYNTINISEIKMVAEISHQIIKFLFLEWLLIFSNK
jgi:hypothetical protein